jgi:Sec-independent protein secretion pathway component TatC
MMTMAKRAGEVIEKAQQEAESTLTRTTATLIRAEEALEASQKAAKTATGQAVEASRTIQAQAARLRWTALAAVAALSLLIGMVLSVGLLIWQPVLIQHLWSIAAPPPGQ